jgi:predicted nicotinamide N-methyase
VDSREAWWLWPEGGVDDTIDLAVAAPRFMGYSREFKQDTHVLCRAWPICALWACAKLPKMVQECAPAWACFAWNGGSPQSGINQRINTHTQLNRRRRRVLQPGDSSPSRECRGLVRTS